MSPLVLDFLKSAVFPGILVAGAVLLLGGQREVWRAGLQALAIALGFCLGHSFLFGTPQVPPGELSHGLVLAAFALVAFVWVRPSGTGARYLVRALMVVGIGTLILWPIREHLRSPIHMRNLLAFFFLGLGVWSILERAAYQVRLPTVIALPLVSTTGLSLLFLFSGSASLFQPVSILCSILGALFLVSIFWPGRLSLDALLPFVSAFVILFMVSGHFYLEINPWRMIILCVPFLVLWLRPWIPFVPKFALAEAAILSVLGGAPVAYLLWKVYKASDPF